jgi:hypothetical protein
MKEYPYACLLTELGIEYISQSESMDEEAEVHNPSNVMDWEDKDRNFQVSDTIA